MMSLSYFYATCIMDCMAISTYEFKSYNTTGADPGIFARGGGGVLGILQWAIILSLKQFKS